MCTDFTNLNKACPNDPYSLLRIDRLDDSTAGCALLSMVDTFQGYHQVFIAEEDEERTSFIIEKGFGSLCRRYGRKEYKRGRSLNPLSLMFQSSKRVWHEAQPNQMHLWGKRRKSFGIFSYRERHRTEPIKGTSYNGDVVTNVDKRGTTVHRVYRFVGTFSIKVRGPEPVVL
ncbi:UNVERIFIED_CONTAM: hypothetical protein Slati_1449700 [Sesamum latifolium]|uniref:Transposon Ty3-I Gag-Pol polyprotein n=1 Tax=Sesamum latifolium TaxID=2727402 RepID=A0AAW2X4U1_9LAMI